MSYLQMGNTIHQLLSICYGQIRPFIPPLYNSASLIRSFIPIRPFIPPLYNSASLIRPFISKSAPLFRPFTTLPL